MNKKLKFVFFILFVTLAISVTSLTLIVYSGYRIDFKNFRLVKTGSLYINTNPGKTDIYLNNKKITQKTPTIINQLNPGEYDLKLVKEGYKEWEQKVEIIPSITSFVNYDLVLKDIELSPANEFGENTYYSSDNRYISYVKYNTETKLNNIFIYDVLTKDEFNVYSTEKQIKKISWSRRNTKLLINMDNGFYVLDIKIIPVINKISSNTLINLGNFVKNIDNIYWNEENDYKIIIKSGKSIYDMDLQSNKINLIQDDFDKNSLVYINNNIFYIKDSSVVEKSLVSNFVYSYNDLKVDDMQDISYLSNEFVISNSSNSLYIFKDFKDNYIKITGKNIKIDKNYIISWDDYEFNVYDKKEKDVKFTTRYSQKILDVDFYAKNYAILILEQDIKLINIGDNVNELNIISNKNNITKVMSFDNKSVFVVYKENQKNIISNLNLQ